jgi:poly-beta-1,6-N-acetyl-D-glucosamine synthase
MPPPLRRLVAGVPAYNTGPRLREAVRSLLSQTLPEGAEWSRVWIVVSGCTDDTAEVADGLALEDARVRVIRQATREGKASALREIFVRAEGDLLVLLNGDATAQPGSVVELLRAAERASGPFAVMGRPCLGPERNRGLGLAIQILWDLHHRLHERTLADRQGNHLSDELWLLPIPVSTSIPTGVVNDGAYLGAWLHGHGGTILYASDARVLLEIPRTPAEHLRQRRRIHWGHRQVEEILGVTPTTWPSYAKQHPSEAVSALLGSARDHPGGVPWTAFLALIELEAMVLAAWDRYIGGKDHVLWDIVSPARPANPARAPTPRVN